MSQKLLAQIILASVVAAFGLTGIMETGPPGGNGAGGSSNERSGGVPPLGGSR